jgi:hypothetical protein
VSTRNAVTAQAPERTTACFVYGIVPGDVTPTEEARGLGDPPAEVATVKRSEIGALVSEVRLDRPLGEPDDLMAYQRLLDGTAAAAPVLPMRFGTVLADRESVEQMLAEGHDAFLAAPYAPVRVLTSLGRVVRQEVLREMYSPAAVRRKVEAIDAAAAAGELSETERVEAQRKVVESVIVRPDTRDESAG